MVTLLNWLPFLSLESSPLPCLLSLTLNKQPSLEFTSPFHLWSCLSSSLHEIYWKSILYTWPLVSLLLFLSSCSIVRALPGSQIASLWQKSEDSGSCLSCHFSTIWLWKLVSPWASKTSNSLGFAPFSLVTFLQCLYPSSKGCCPQLSSTPPVLSSTSTPVITTLRGMTRRSTVDLQKTPRLLCWTPDLNLHLLNAHTWRRQWHPSPVLLPGKSHGWRNLVGCSPRGLEESDTTELLHFHFHALEKEMATHSSVLAWRIPGTGEPGRLPSMGLHRVGHDWIDLAAAAAATHTLKSVTLANLLNFP